ncbi:MAG: hypothetical protein ABL888_23295 [Pirellulaceae bacterium]
MIRSIQNSIHPVFASFFGVFLTACAVTQIDVDVYKGPLVNQEDIQLQQFAVLAIGAKPHLVDLRDSLEWGSSTISRLSKEPTWTLRLKELRALYQPKYIPSESYRFCDDYAKRLNDILSLYEPRPASKKGEPLDLCPRQYKFQDGPELTGGRLEDGLEILIEEFLIFDNDALTHDKTSKDPNLERAKIRLVNSLVQFGQKVLFLTNNQYLLSFKEKRARSDDIFSDVSVTIARDIWTTLGDWKDMFFGNADRAFASDQQGRSVAILQAVGNSLVNEADELRRQIEYYQKTAAIDEKTGSKLEISSIHSLDRMITTLRREHIQALAKGDNSGAQALAGAIKAAYDHRANLAYIRPASAFLRNSYPASALQSDPRVGWQNLLSQSAERALPFFSQKVANWAERERLAVRTEFDKQYWQNINNVRVSGSGLTNTKS